jgi:hypothetical protein
MAICPPSGCFDNWGDIDSASLCGGTKSGGINAAIIFRCGVSREDIVEDYDADTLDNDKIEALITAGDAKVVGGIQVTLNAPSELSAPSGNPCIGEAPINYDRSLTWQDFNINRNRSEFYDSINAVNGFPIGGLLLLHCEENMISYVESDVRFSGGRQSPEQSSDAAFYEFNVTWRKKKDTELFEQTIDAFNA